MGDHITPSGTPQTAPGATHQVAKTKKKKKKPCPSVFSNVKTGKRPGGASTPIFKKAMYVCTSTKKETKKKHHQRTVTPPKQTKKKKKALYKPEPETQEESLRRNNSRVRILR